MSHTEVFYKKQGRKYVPVYHYDAQVMDSFPEGAHIVVVKPGNTSKTYRIDPAFAPMIAAGKFAEDAISKSIMEASKLRCPSDRQPLTKEQRDLWDQLAKAFGQETYALEWPSYREAAEAGVKALTQEAEKLLANPSVRSAYEHFLLMCKLASENANE